MSKVSREELRNKLALWRWNGDAIRYLCGDNETKPSERALLQIDEIMKLIDQYTDAIVDEVIGEDEITYANYEDGFFGGKKVTRDKLRTEQRQRYQAMKQR